MRHLLTSLAHRALLQVVLGVTQDKMRRRKVRRKTRKGILTTHTNLKHRTRCWGGRGRDK